MPCLLIMLPSSSPPCAKFPKVKGLFKGRILLGVCVYIHIYIYVHIFRLGVRVKSQGLGFRKKSPLFSSLHEDPV